MLHKEREGKGKSARQSDYDNNTTQGCCVWSDARQPSSALGCRVCLHLGLLLQWMSPGCDAAGRHTSANIPIRTPISRDSAAMGISTRASGVCGREPLLDCPSRDLPACCEA